MTDILIEGGRALLGGDILEASLTVERGEIRDIGKSGQRGTIELDARGLLVLPGIVDHSFGFLSEPVNGRCIAEVVGEDGQHCGHNLWSHRSCCVTIQIDPAHRHDYNLNHGLRPD